MKSFEACPVRSISHSTQGWTQGLACQESTLYESTGLYGTSGLHEIDSNTGEIRHSIALCGDLYGEGVAIVGDGLVQLTWREQVALTYQREGLVPKEKLPYDGEGWGATGDGKGLITSDGSEILTWRDQDCRAVRRVSVSFQGTPLRKINDLALAKGKIYANVYGRDELFGICPSTGQVREVIDCRALRDCKVGAKGAGLLNGLAYTPVEDAFFVTGKQWTQIHVVRFVGRLKRVLFDCVWGRKR